MTGLSQYLPKYLRSRGRSAGNASADGWGRRGTAGATFASSLTFDAVTRSYADKVALKSFSLEIAAGEVVCLLGPSGGGKSTLLRIAAGIEKPTSGRVLLDGREVAGPNRFEPPEKRNVGLMFQDFALFPHLSIIDNVAFGLRALPKSDARRVASAALSRVGLIRYAEDFPHILSGGEQQRVALARAIAPRPNVLLMDEPFSGLDIELRASMQEQTLAILRETRATSLLVTHSSDEALRMSDRIAVMNSGGLVQVGKAEELYHHPANLFVARLFSKINELAGIVMGERVETALGTFQAPGFQNGDPVIVCVRQRSITLREGVTVGAGGEAGCRARVIGEKFLGDATQLQLAVEGLDDTLIMRMPARKSPDVGSNIIIEVDPRDTLVFPATDLSEVDAAA